MDIELSCPCPAHTVVVCCNDISRRAILNAEWPGLPARSPASKIGCVRNGEGAAGPLPIGWVWGRGDLSSCLSVYWKGRVEPRRRIIAVAPGQFVAPATKAASRSECGITAGHVPQG